MYINIINRMETIFIFPNTLFEHNKLINKKSKVYIIEHPVFFSLHKYHKLKIILHRASMKYYSDYLKKKYKCYVKYIDHHKIIKESLESVFNIIKSNDIHFYDPVDHLVVRDIKKIAKKNNKKIIAHDTPLFISKLGDLKEYYLKSKKLIHNSFYIWQRTRFNILLNKNKKPYGKKWSFDNQNRLPFPKKFNADSKLKSSKSKYIFEAKKYVNKYFKDNPGTDNFYLSVDFIGAKRHLIRFINKQLECFGPYQDAVDKKIIFGCHSVISPYLNIGLLTPKYVIRKLEKIGLQKRIPLSSLEGIIRQILGWREYVRMIYMFKRKELENSNHFNHRRKLNRYWFNKVQKDNGSQIPVINDLINKTFDYGYLHHIERLMYIGNYMLITQINPKDCFRWFMEMFIDSYNWVMYANVYGMSQYSAGPIITTRPYFSSSNYIHKMSNYKKKKNIYNKVNLNNNYYEWYKIWDALYYKFINDNKKELSKNYATARQVKHWKNKNKKDQKILIKIANEYIKKY